MKISKLGNGKVNLTKCAAHQKNNNKKKNQVNSNKNFIKV